MIKYALLLKNCNRTLYFVGYSRGYALFSLSARTYSKEEAKKIAKNLRDNYRLIPFDVPDDFDC